MKRCDAESLAPEGKNGSGRPAHGVGTVSSSQLRLISIEEGGESGELLSEGPNGTRPLPFARSTFDGPNVGTWLSSQCSRKSRGGYYTPVPIAAYLCEWGIQVPGAKVLEPSAGDGAFVAAALPRLGDEGRVVAVELFSDEARKAAIIGGARTTLVTGDFFSWFAGGRVAQTFDAALGNPPFIRYQDFPEEQRRPAFALMCQEGLHPTRLTNAWMPFVVAATVALKPGGRLGMVVPAELLQVNYASELREYLARKYSHLTVLTFRKLAFYGIQQETVLLLGVRQESQAAEISVLELDGVEDLKPSLVASKHRPHLKLDHAVEKWTQFLLSPKELGLIRELENSDAFCKLGELAEVDIGIVTGRNEFFVLTQLEATRFNVSEWCVPLVGRSAQIPGLVLREEDWNGLVNDGTKCFLVQFGGADRGELQPTQLAYVKYGEGARFHEGYKCRIRLPRWWNVPSVWQPDAFLLRQIHDGPRIVENRAGVVSTDTIHRVRLRRGTAPSWLAAASLNSLTLAFSEIRGRSYGGGVLELEPREAEGLPFPRPDGRNLSVDALDSLVRRQGLEAALEEVDRAVLWTAGLTAAETSMLRGIWRKLSSRRINRKRHQPP